MTERTHEELKGLVAAYVLGAVPSDEVGLVRSHILTCDECMAEADQHSAALDSLALAVEPMPVPAGFSERVMAQIAPAPEVETASAAAPRRSWVPEWLRARGLAVAGGMAALILLGVVGSGWIQARQDLARTEDVLSALLHGDGIQLRGDGGAAAELVPKSQGAVMAVAGLPEAPGSHVYQLWYMDDDGKPVSVGTFETRDSVVVMQVAEDFDGYEDAAITVEPSGGSRQPTSDPVVASF